MNYYVVKYSGPFGFIKPWTAVRDGETFSQQFLTASTIEGIEKKLFPELLSRKGLQGHIVGHRLNYTGLSRQQEQTWSKGWIEKKGEPIMQQVVITKKGVEQIKEVKIQTVTRRPATGILTRGVLLEPNLYLAFSSKEYAHRASKQHICLSRNEDVLLPVDLEQCSEAEWTSDRFPGFELLIDGESSARKFKVGYNRFHDASAMFGEVRSYGDPIRKPLDIL
jgi:hypothetical protein